MGGFTDSVHWTVQTRGYKGQNGWKMCCWIVRLGGGVNWLGGGVNWLSNFLSTTSAVLEVVRLILYLATPLNSFVIYFSIAVFSPVYFKRLNIRAFSKQFPLILKWVEL